MYAQLYIYILNFNRCFIKNLILALPSKGRDKHDAKENSLLQSHAGKHKNTNRKRSFAQSQTLQPILPLPMVDYTRYCALPSIQPKTLNFSNNEPVISLVYIF